MQTVKIAFIVFTGLSNISSVTLMAVLVIWGIYTAGVFLIYIYRMNKIWDDVQQFESEIYDTISQVHININPFYSMMLQLLS